MLIGLWAAVGWAQPARGHAAWWGETPLPALLKAAGVSDDQKAQIKALAAAHRPTLRNLHAELRAAYQKLGETLLMAGDPAPTVEQITRLRGDLLTETVQMRQAMLGVLTAEQRGKVAELQGQLRTLRAQRHDLLRGETPSAQ
jgi:hypothetical protein